MTDCTEPSCQQALERLQAFLDGELPATSIDEIRTHLTACYPCADRASFEDQLRLVVRNRCQDRAPASLVERIRGGLKLA